MITQHTTILPYPALSGRSYLWR